MRRGANGRRDSVVGGGAAPAPVTADDVIDHAVQHLAELVVVLDQAGTILFANDAITRLLGWDPEVWVGRASTELAHPDDAAIGLEVLTSDKASGVGVKEPLLYRLAHADGSWVPVESIASVVRLDDGAPVLVVSARPAGTARPPAAILDQVAKRVSDMFERSLLGMAQVGVDGRILRANERFAHLVGALEGSALLHRQLAELIHDDEGDVLHGPDGLLTGEGGHRAQVRLCPIIDAPELPATWARLAASLVDDHRGQPLYYALQAVDISDLVQAQAELVAAEASLRHRSQHDPLTGLPNRVQLAEWLDLPAYGDDAVLFIDLDGFKAVNDTFGHATGDEVLVAVSACLRTHVRRTDMVARLGGDEFVVLCPRTGEEIAAKLARRLVDAIAHPVRTGQGELKVEASIGVATGDAASTYESVIARADLALYEAKDADTPSSISIYRPGSVSFSEGRRPQRGSDGAGRP